LVNAAICLVIGHRGAMAYAPENTLASFREARRRGATWSRSTSS
jgi:glycerophosphoryl diester phosphodiesterase